MIQLLIHDKNDTVGVATVDIKAGETAIGLTMDSGDKVEVKALTDIPPGHKIAVRDCEPGDTVIKYGHDIGNVVASIVKPETLMRWHRNGLRLLWRRRLSLKPRPRGQSCPLSFQVSSTR